MSYWFFLSYAKLDRNPSLTQFYEDLAKAVQERVQAGGKWEDIGFFDGEPGLAQPWTEKLEDGLQTCRSFVALYSVPYFDNVSCGKQWQVFSSRLSEFATSVRQPRPPLIFPVLWRQEKVPKPQLAAIAKDVPYKHTDFGELYAEKGLFELMTKHHDLYGDFLGNFAKQLSDLAKRYRLPPLDGIQISMIKSAFSPREAQPLPSADETYRPSAHPTEHYDVFLSYRSEDQAIVEDIARMLKRKGLEPWFDKWCVRAGQPVQTQIERGMGRSSSCAVFIGQSRLGDWQDPEQQIAIDRGTKDRDFSVIPVLLPGLPEPFDRDSLPPFLSLRGWVDLRGGLSDPLACDLLVSAIKGFPESPELNSQ
jgi:hypothetical protein